MVGINRELQGFNDGVRKLDASAPGSAGGSTCDKRLPLGRPPAEPGADGTLISGRPPMKGAYTAAMAALRGFQNYTMPGRLERPTPAVPSYAVPLSAGESLTTGLVDKAYEFVRQSRRQWTVTYGRRHF